MYIYSVSFVVKWEISLLMTYIVSVSALLVQCPDVGSILEHSFHLGIFGSNEEVELAVHEWLQMKVPHFFLQGIFKLFRGWNSCISARCGGLC